MAIKILLLILTYNRLDKLKKLIKSLHDQTYSNFELLIIDNCSTDETQEYISKIKPLHAPFKLHSYRTLTNKGASDGYHFGFQKANAIGYDWLYVGDDDAYFDKDVLSKFILLISKFYDTNIFCGSVFDSSLNLDTTHRRNYKLSIFGFLEFEIPSNFYKQESIDIKLFSFVGLFVNFKVVSLIGLPNRNYFIWWDDTEYSIRVSKKFSVKLIPELRFYHDTQKASIPNWKEYYGIRNRLYTIKKLFPWWIIFIEESKHLMKIIKFIITFNNNKAKLYYFSYIDYKCSRLGVSKREINY